MIKKRKILVIDDDVDLRQSLEDQLAMSGEFRIVTAETAAKGMELSNPQLLLTEDGGYKLLPTAIGSSRRGHSVASYGAHSASREEPSNGLPGHQSKN